MNVFRKAIKNGIQRSSNSTFVTIAVPMSVVDSPMPVLPKNLKERQVNEDGTTTDIFVHHVNSPAPPTNHKLLFSSSGVPYVISYEDGTWSWFEVVKTIVDEDTREIDTIDEVDSLRIIDLELWRARNLWGEAPESSVQSTIIRGSQLLTFIYYSIDQGSIYYTFSISFSDASPHTAALELKKKITAVRRLGGRARVLRRFMNMRNNSLT